MLYDCTVVLALFAVFGIAGWCVLRTVRKIWAFVFWFKLAQLKRPDIGRNSSPAHALGKLNLLGYDSEVGLCIALSF